MGLAEFMCFMSKIDNRSSLVFKVWAGSITTFVPSYSWKCTADFSQIRKAVSLKRDGLRFFTMRRAFFFDCFYLVSKLDSKFLKEAYSFLNEHVKDIIARRILNNVYNNWDKSTLKKIPLQLIAQQKTDKVFHNQPLKRILVVATMSAGKSTLINALVGYRVNEVKATACTNKLCYLYNKPIDDGISAKRADGCYMYRYNIEAVEKGVSDEIALHFNSTLSNSRVCLIDTPGVNYSGDKNHGEITRKAIASNDYDAIIFVSNALYFDTEDERMLLDYTISHTKKQLIFVLNQLDGFNPRHDSIKETCLEFDSILKAKKIRSLVVPLSGYYSFLLRVGQRNKLDEVEIDDLQKLNKRFQKDFYCLPAYYPNNTINANTQDRELFKSGITLLEKIIKSV